MITDETAGSGGDMLPWMFHKFGLGRSSASVPGEVWWVSLGFRRFLTAAE